MKTGVHRSSMNARSGGFTLIEMLMVLGLIAIFFFTIGIPAFVQAQRNNKTAIRQAVVDVQTGLRNARSRAILQQKPMEFVLTPQPGGVQMSVEEVRGRNVGGGGVGLPDDSAKVSPWGSEDFSAVLDPTIDIELLDVNGVDILRLEVEEPEARVRFHPNGICDDFRLVLQSPERITRLITTEVTTGIATVEKVER